MSMPLKTLWLNIGLLLKPCGSGLTRDGIAGKPAPIEPDSALGVSLLAPLDNPRQQLLEHHMGRCRQVFAIVERLELFHISALRQFQLHSMDIIHRAAVMTGDMATLEAPVQYMTVGRMLGTNGFQVTGQRRIATGAIKGAQVEVRQTAVKQMRDLDRKSTRLNSSH